MQDFTPLVRPNKVFFIALCFLHPSVTINTWKSVCIYWLEKKIGDENRNYLKQNLLTRAITDPAHIEKKFFLLRLLPLSLDTANHESNSCASEQNHSYESGKFWQFLFIIWQNGLSSDLLGHSISTGPMVPRSYPHILIEISSIY